MQVQEEAQRAFAILRPTASKLALPLPVPQVNEVAHSRVIKPLIAEQALQLCDADKASIELQAGNHTPAVRPLCDPDKAPITMQATPPSSDDITASSSIRNNGTFSPEPVGTQENL